jgi:hypothetical protein
MSDDERTRDDTSADTGVGETIEREMPDPDEMPGGRMGRHEGEGKPGSKDPGATREATGA